MNRTAKPTLHFVDSDCGLVTLGYAELAVEKHCGRNWYRIWRSVDGWQFEPIQEALIPGLAAAKTAIRSPTVHESAARQTEQP